MAGFLVADIKRLTARVGNRIVLPRGEPKLVTVLCPGVGAAALGDDGAELRIGDYVDPRRGGSPAEFEQHDIFAPVAAEPAQAVEKCEVALVHLRLGRF